MKATMNFVELQENAIQIGGIRVYWEYAFHPGAAICFRVEASDSKLGYMTDNEFLKGYIGHPARALATPFSAPPLRQAHSVLLRSRHPHRRGPIHLRGVSQEIGWGHTSASNACILAKARRNPPLVRHSPRPNP